MASLATPSSADIIALDAILVRIWSGAAYGAGVQAFNFCTPSVTLIDATYYPLNGLAIPQVITHAATGAAAGNSLPPEVSMVVTVRTPQRGRSQRGRIFLPPMAVSTLTTAGNWGAATITSVVTQTTGVWSALAGIGWEFGVASYITVHTVNGQPTGGASTPHFTNASSFTVDAKPDVQRRRK